MAAEQKLEARAPEEIQEMPLVELAYQILASTNEPHYYRDLMKKVAEFRSMSEEEVEDAIARLYTDINIDGRFLCIGDNVWGLRRWYPVERVTERGTSKRFVRKEVAEDEDLLDDADEEFELEEEDLIEEEPFVFEDEETIDEDSIDEEEIDFLEESEVEEELDEEEQDIDDEEEEF